MRLRTIGAALAGAAVLACTAQTGGMTAEDEAAAIAAIEQVMVDELATIMAEDLEAYRLLISDDVRMMAPGGPMVVGADATVAMMEEFMAVTEFNDAMYLTNDISVYGDEAVHVFTSQWTTTTMDGEPVTETAKGIHLLERTADGRWVITADVWNTDTAPEYGEEDM